MRDTVLLLLLIRMTVAQVNARIVRVYYVQRCIYRNVERIAQLTCERNTMLIFKWRTTPTVRRMFFSPQRHRQILS